MISVSRMGPLVVAVAASALLAVGPASADTSDPPPPSDTTTTTAPTSTTTTAPSGAAPTTTSRGTATPPSSGPRKPSGGGGPAGAPPNRPGRAAGDRDCADFATQKEAQQYFESIGGSSTQNADRLDENHNGVACESLSDDGDNQDAAATATGDDGSDATTSGKQVTDVPEGSAQTGGI